MFVRDSFSPTFCTIRIYRKNITTDIISMIHANIDSSFSSNRRTGLENIIFICDT